MRHKLNPCVLAKDLHNFSEIILLDYMYSLMGWRNTIAVKKWRLASHFRSTCPYQRKRYTKNHNIEPQRLDLRGQYYKVFACICAHHHKKHSTGHYLNLKRKPSYPVLSMSLLTSITVSCSVVRTEHTGFHCFWSIRSHLCDRSWARP